MTTRMRIAKIPKEELEKRCTEGSMYADFVPIGKWERRWNGDTQCSECGYIWEHLYDDRNAIRPNFCPFCGADMREKAPTDSVLDEIAAKLEELEKTEPFAYGDTKIRMGVGLGIMKARKIVDNYREEGNTE